jgi:hypothetical protein
MKRTTRQTKEASMTTPQILSSTTFGPFSRFRLDEFRTRFGDVVWMVLDAERPDRQGRPTVIRQASSREEAVAGLEVRS